MDDLLPEIEAFCRAHDVRESRFGRDAVNDTTFIPQLRSGREPRRGTVARVREFMATYRPVAAQSRSPEEQAILARAGRIARASA